MPNHNGVSSADPRYQIQYCLEHFDLFCEEPLCVPSMCIASSFYLCFTFKVACNILCLETNSFDFVLLSLQLIKDHNVFESYFSTVSN